MRRLVLTCVVLLAAAGPAAAATGMLGPTTSESTLVVQNADNGDGIASGARPVVTLVIHGFVIGRVAEQGRIAIYDLDQTDQSAPEVTGAVSHEDVSRTVKAADGTQTQQTGTQWTGTDFRFRAVDGTYRVVIWGSGVYLFASGDQGRVWLTGQTDNPRGDGKYSLNGEAWRSLPVAGVRDIAPPAPTTPSGG
jgi:hypothetical protein